MAVYPGRIAHFSFSERDTVLLYKKHSLGKMSPPHLSLIIVPNDIAASWGHGTGLAKTRE
jgi:hypothetical protein